MAGDPRRGAARALAVGLDHAARFPDAGARQRWRGVRGAVGAERSDRRPRRDLAILDGRGRGVQCRRRAAAPRCCSPAWWSGSAGSCSWCGRSSPSGRAGIAAFSLGVIAVQIAAFGWSLGSSYSKRLDVKREHPRPDGAADAVWRHPDDDRRNAARRVAEPVLLDALVQRPDVPRDRRGARRIRGLQLRAAAPAVSFVSLYAYINPSSRLPSAYCSCTSPSPRAWLAPPRLVFAGVAVVRWARRTNSAAHSATAARNAAPERRRQIA